MKRIEAKGTAYRDLVIVNPGDRSWTRHRYILWFGATGTTFLMVWANSLDDALDEAVDWLADHAPGHLADNEVYAEAMRLMQEEGVGHDMARIQAEQDCTIAGNAGHYLHSWEWGVYAEDPDRETILDMLGRGAA